MNTTAEATQVMLVEDDPTQAKLYAAILRNALGNEIQLVVFHDPETAALYLGRNWIDVLVTDLQMPHLDGIDLIRLAKDRFRGVQVVVLTAASTADRIIAAADLGAADYLLKPFAEGLLPELVRQAQARVERWRRALAGTLRQEISQTAIRNSRPDSRPCEADENLSATLPPRVHQ